MSATIFFHLGLIAYAAAAVIFFAHLAKATERRARLAGRSLLIGFGFHGVAVAMRFLEISRGGAFRLAEGLSFIAFLVVGAYLLLGRWYRIPTIGAFVAPLVVATLLPAHAIPAAEVGGNRPFDGPILPLHIGVAVGGVALFALAFVVALLYLLLEREVKAKKPGAMFRRLPSLDLLDRLNYQLVLLGFVMLSITIGTGAFFSQSETGIFFALRSKEGFSLLAWLVVALVVLLRQTIGWRGRRVAWATMAGFVLLTSAFAGVFTGVSL